MSPRKILSERLSRLAAAVLLAALCACRGEPEVTFEELDQDGGPEQYSATVIVTVNDGPPRESAVFRSGGLFREEWVEDGETRAYIWRPDIGKSYLLSLDRRIYVESSADAGPLEAGQSQPAPGADQMAEAIETAIVRTAPPAGEEVRALPDEVIDGHPCAVVERRARLEGGVVETVTTFKARDLSGLPLKIISETDSADGPVRVIIRRGNVQTTVDRQMFMVPSGFKKADSLF